MKISIIGAGHVGGALGSGWARHGHEITFGVRNAKKTDSATTAKIVSVMEAAQSADLIVLSVPWGAVADALLSSGDLEGKILLDATNPLLPDLSGLDPASGTSGAETIATLSGASVIKIFNTTGYPNMANPDYHGERATMFYCGDDVNAKRIAAGLASDLGFEPVDAGPLSRARLLESLALLWITLAVKQGYGVNMAFRMMRR
jgi:predicted dinucleotide-binding enzyme